MYNNVVKLAKGISIQGEGDGTACTVVNFGLGFLLITIFYFFHYNNRQFYSWLTTAQAVYSECPKSKRSVWETEQKIVRFSAHSNFRRSRLKILLEWFGFRTFGFQTFGTT